MHIANNVNARNVFTSLDADAQTPLVIDFSEAAFVEPVGLVAAAALAENARNEGRVVSFVAPVSADSGNYMARMGMATVLNALEVPNNVVTVRANPLPTQLLELQRVEGVHAGEQVAELVFNKLEAAHVDPVLRDTLHTSICEMVGNIELHASISGGYVAAQTTHSGSRILFAIADAGRGIRASLEENRTIVTDGDQQALDFAVMRNISATGERGRGQGLPEVVESSVGLNGIVHIASGSAYSRFSRENTDKRVLVNAFPGTIIQVELTL